MGRADGSGSAFSFPSAAPPHSEDRSGEKGQEFDSASTLASQFGLESSSAIWLGLTLISALSSGKGMPPTPPGAKSGTFCLTMMVRSKWQEIGMPFRPYSRTAYPVFSLLERHMPDRRRSDNRYTRQLCRAGL